MADLYLVSWVDSSFDDWLLEGSDYEHDGEVIKLSNETGICRFGEWILPVGQYVFIRYKGEGSLILQDKDGNEETTALSSSNWTNSLVSFTSDKIFYVIRLKSASGSDLEVDFIGFTSAKLLGNVVLRADWSERKEIVSSDSLGATQLTQSIASRRELRIETRMLRDEWKKFDLAFAKYSHLVLIKPSSIGGVGIATLDSSGADWVVPFQLLRYDTDLIAPHTTRTRITGSTILQDPMSISRFPISKGMSFDGEDDYVDCDSISSLGQSFTVILWSKRSGSTGDYGNLFNIDGASWSTTGGFLIFDANDGNIRARLRNHADSSETGVSLETSVPNGIWRVYAVTWDRPTFKGFRDGVEVDSTTWDHDVGWDQFLTEVGKWTSHYFFGTITQVLVYDHALTSDEIRYVIKHPLNPIKTGLVLWLSNRITAETWYDESGNDFHGTIYGATPVKVIP